MKTVAIDTLAAWAATLSAFQDGDIFRESNLDIIIDGIGDRLGYLKTAVDGKVADDDDVTWTGLHVFNHATDGVEFQKGVVISAIGLEVTGGIIVNTGGIGVTGDLSFDAAVNTGIVYRLTSGSDAAISIDATSDEVRCPAITANRVWTVDSTPAPTNGRRLRVSRPRTADAFSLTLQREDATVLCVFAASTSGYVDLVYSGGWKVSGHHGGTSVNTDV